MNKLATVQPEQAARLNLDGLELVLLVDFRLKLQPLLIGGGFVPNSFFYLKIAKLGGLEVYRLRVGHLAWDNTQSFTMLVQSAGDERQIILATD